MSLEKKVISLLCGAAMLTGVYAIAPKIAGAENRPPSVYVSVPRLQYRAIRVKPFIDTRTEKSAYFGFGSVPIDVNSQEDMSFYGEVLDSVSDSLYSTFGLKLYWNNRHYLYRTSFRDTTSTAFKKFRRYVRTQPDYKKQIYVLFFAGEDSDGAAGLASLTDKAIIVDTDIDLVKCTISTTLHEIGHVLGAEHIINPRYVMSKLNNLSCSMKFSEKNKRLVFSRLKSGSLDELIAYR